MDDSLIKEFRGRVKKPGTEVQCHLVKFKIVKLRSKSSDLLLKILSAKKSR